MYIAAAPVPNCWNPDAQSSAVGSAVKTSYFHFKSYTYSIAATASVESKCEVYVPSPLSVHNVAPKHHAILEKCHPPELSFANKQRPAAPVLSLIILAFLASSSHVCGNFGIPLSSTSPASSNNSTLHISPNA